MIINFEDLSKVKAEADFVSKEGIVCLEEKECNGEGSGDSRKNSDQELEQYNATESLKKYTKGSNDMPVNDSNVIEGDEKVEVNATKLSGIHHKKVKALSFITKSIQFLAIKLLAIPISSIRI